jgi:hypothetical protein
MGHPALVKCGEGIRGVIRWSEGRVLGDALRSECVDLVRRWNMFARLSDGVYSRDSPIAIQPSARDGFTPS